MFPSEKRVNDCDFSSLRNAPSQQSCNSQASVFLTVKIAFGEKVSILSVKLSLKHWAPPYCWICTCSSSFCVFFYVCARRFVWTYVWFGSLHMPEDVVGYLLYQFLPYSFETECVTWSWSYAGGQHSPVSDRSSTLLWLVYRQAHDNAQLFLSLLEL